MKRVVVFSDSHGCKQNLLDAFGQARLAGPIHTVVFLGDGARDFDALRPILQAERIQCHSVAGNNDWSSSDPDEIEFSVDGIRFFACHGHTRGVKYGRERLFYAAQERGAHVALYGHTHVPSIELDYGLFLVNPGTVGQRVCGCPAYAEIRLESGGTVIPKLVNWI